MAPRFAMRRLVLTHHKQITTSSQPCRNYANQTRLTTTRSSRPIVPFLSTPKTNPNSVRLFTSERKKWWKHEAKLVARYTLTLWGSAICILTIFFAINEEVVERQFPTPHEWHYLTRKFLRDANEHRDPKNGEVNWARCLELSRGVVIRLEDPKTGGQDVLKLSDKLDTSLEVPGEFIACDISAKSEEWRRGYFEAIMLAAKAAEHVDGWLRDVTRNVVTPPEFVIGPSNPRPTPIPPGNPHAPREEDCELAYPAADNWYVKILATKGLTQRQKMEAALEYASYMEYKNNIEASGALYQLALAEASQSVEPSKLPYDPKTYILKDRAAPPSSNILDALTAMATHKARKGELTSALPIYISILKSRRSLPVDPPKLARATPARTPIYRQVLQLFAPPDYPPPPPDGADPPWRGPLERCQEASLNLYIGEILYATGSRDDGLAWTRDAVDAAEEQLRGLRVADTAVDTKRTCRECLSTGLGNWATMVAKLAKQEEEKKSQGSKAGSGYFSFWSASQEGEGRWEAEEAVVQERVRRTKELVEELPLPSASIWTILKA